MKIEQIYTGCLAQGAYYIESNGEAAIVDPLREVQQYIDMAKENGSRIKYIFETHFHADFVSGHLTLSEKTGAPIIYGPTANPSFDAIIAKDGQVFELGDIKIKVLHTPGHTMESSSYLVFDENDKEYALFSGDTLFLGDVGRPDLAQKAANMTQDQLAGLLYDSLRSKIMTLPDDLIIYPAHGAGSACGKNMMKETVDTLGNQKKVNYALRANMSRDEFITEVTDGLATPPAYFPMNVKMNKEGYASIDYVLERGMHARAPREFELIANETGAIILDVRHQNQFVKSHVPRSIFIGLDGSFAPWVGALIKDTNQAILLVADEDRVEEAVTRLSRVGFDNTLGYLKGGMTAWKNAGFESDSIESITAQQLKEIQKANPSIEIVDVRRPGEFASEHALGAENFDLDNLNNHLAALKSKEHMYIHCASGYRSVVAASILKARGLHNLTDIAGGFKAMKDNGIEVTDYVCPSTLK